MVISQYYNQARRRMEIPILGGSKRNHISFCSLVNTDLTTTFAGLPPGEGDTVKTLVNDVYNTAEFFAGDGWYEYEPINPIQAGVGYQYTRIGADCTWIYDCVFFPSATRSQLCRPVGTKGLIR